ncbi:tyrosine-type recombinase/integrase [Pseudomonas iridis]|uniref:Tyrosine-type recombinase/integrase n=1 Tax=Pseudomonas iridis TaxID=2710587 RepID=A0ABW8DLU6_9PSED
MPRFPRLSAWKAKCLRAKRSIEITKAKPPLLLANTAVIEKYIREENLSADDYLFPSDDRKQPMSTSQLLGIFQSWEREAQLPRSALTPSTLRRAAMAQLAASTPPQQPGKRIADQLGHSSSSMTEQYDSLSTTAVDAALKTAK